MTLRYDRILLQALLRCKSDGELIWTTVLQHQFQNLPI